MFFNMYVLSISFINLPITSKGDYINDGQFFPFYYTMLPSDLSTMYNSRIFPYSSNIIFSVLLLNSNIQITYFDKTLPSAMIFENELIATTCTSNPITSIKFDYAYNSIEDKNFLFAIVTCKDLIIYKILVNKLNSSLIDSHVIRILPSGNITQISNLKVVGDWFFISLTNPNTYISYNYHYKASNKGEIANIIFLTSSRITDFFIKENGIHGEVQMFALIYVYNGPLNNNVMKLAEFRIGPNDECFVFNNFDYGISPFCTLNCPLYKYVDYSNNPGKCLECEPGYFVENDVCVSNCSDSSNNPNGYCSSNSLNINNGRRNFNGSLNFKYECNSSSCLSNEVLIDFNCIICDSQSFKDGSNTCIISKTRYKNPFTGNYDYCIFPPNTSPAYYSLLDAQCQTTCDNLLIHNLCVCSEKMEINDILPNTCVSNCPIEKPLKTITYDMCDSCSSIGMYNLDGVCVSNCGSIKEPDSNNICIDFPPVQSSSTSDTIVTSSEADPTPTETPSDTIVASSEADPTPTETPSDIIVSSSEADPTITQTSSNIVTQVESSQDSSVNTSSINNLINLPTNSTITCDNYIQNSLCVNKCKPDFIPINNICISCSEAGFRFIYMKIVV